MSPAAGLERGDGVAGDDVHRGRRGRRSVITGRPRPTAAACRWRCGSWVRQLAQLVDLGTPRSRVVPAAVADSTYDEPGTAGVVELELLGAQAERVAAERGAAAGPDPGHQRAAAGCRRESSSAPLPNSAIAQSPAELSEPGAEYPGDRPERIFVSSPSSREVSITRPTCGSCSGAVMTLVISHGWLLTGAPSVRWAWARMCARVLNRPPGVRLSMRLSPDLSRLVKPSGVLAGHQHLVGHRRAVRRHGRAAVRLGRPGPRPVRPARFGAGGGLEQLLQFDVLVELLELPVPLV